MTTLNSASAVFDKLVANTRLRHLQLVTQVATLGSVQRAADMLGIGQSAATKMLGELERMLDVQLFHRHARGMVPSSVCLDLLPLMNQAMAALASCASAAAATHMGIEGTVRIGAVTAGVTGLLNPILPPFLANHPHVRVELLEEALPTLLGRYAECELDLLITRAPALIVSGSEFIELIEDICVVAARPDHPLVGRRNLGPSHVHGYPWASPPLHSQAYHAFESFFRETGLPNHQPLSTRSLSTILHYLRSSDALLMGPLSFMRGALEAKLIAQLDCAVNAQLVPLGLTRRLEPRNRSVAALQEYLIHKC